MSDPRTEERLDAMLAPLRDRPAELDELAQARIRARLEAAIADDVSPAETGKGRAWRIAGISAAVALGAAAVIAVVTMTIAKPHVTEPGAAAHGASGGVAASRNASIDREIAGAGGAIRSTAAGEPATAGSDPGATDGVAMAGSTMRSGAMTGLPGGDGSAMAGSTMGSAAVAGSARGEVAPIAVEAGQSAQVRVGGAAVTVYGPGRLSPMPDGAVAEGTGVVVDRTEGDRPWSMRYHGATVVAMHATFALDLASGPRVTVVRGQISLRCSSGERTIRAGASGSCPPEEVRASPQSRPTGSLPPPASPRPLASPEPASATRAPVLPEIRREADGVLPQAARTDRYAAAEVALRRGDVEGARRALLAVIEAAPDSLDAATALLDLARLAASRAETASALEYLERLDHHPRRATLAAAAAHLRAALAPAAIIHLPPVP